MSDLYFLNRQNKERNFNQIDNAIHSRHDKHLTSMRSAIEPKLPVRFFEADSILSHRLNRPCEQLEFLIQSFSLGFFPLFLLYLLVFAHVASLEVQVFCLDPGLGVELDIMRLLFAFC